MEIDKLNRAGKSSGTVCHFKMPRIKYLTFKTHTEHFTLIKCNEIEYLFSASKRYLGLLKGALCVGIKYVKCRYERIFSVRLNTVNRKL